MTGTETVHVAFTELRSHCDPRGHELLQSLEELCVEAVECSRTIAAHVAVLEHERRVERSLDEWRAAQLKAAQAFERMGKWPNLRSLGR